jgi:hypothetical protein
MRRGARREQLGDRVVLQCACADALPLANGSSDETVAARLLNFAPDADAPCGGAASIS